MNIFNNFNLQDILKLESYHNYYVDLLRRRKDIITVFFVTCVFLVTVGSFIIRPVYRATVTLLVDIESPNMLTASGTVTLGAQDYYSYKEYFQSQMEIITSRPLLREVFNELDLGKTKEYSRLKDPIKRFSNSIIVEPIRDTRLLKLHAENKNPELAAKIANRLAEAYVRRNLVYISKNEFLNLLKNEYLKLGTKLSEYSKIYKDDHPEMIRLKKEISELVNKMDSQAKTVSTSDYTGKESQGEGYLSEIKGLKSNNVNIVAPAEVPVSPIKPRKTLNIFISILVGLFGGIGIAFFLESVEDKVKSIEDIERLVDCPLLGHVQNIDIKGEMSNIERYTFLTSKPADPTSEAFRSFRTSLLFCSTEEHPLKSMLVTSPGPGEGKTFTLINLGIALAQNNKRVIIIDGDMRKPQFQDIFKKENNKGLSNFLSGQAGFKECIQNTNIENLSIVTSGPFPPNPSELLSSHKLKDFIEKAKEDFDFVILDSPPISILTDAAIMSQKVDGVVVVIESGKTSKKLLSRIHKLLNNAKARVVGTFFNKAPLSSFNHYYSSYYNVSENKASLTSNSAKSQS